MSKNTAQQHTTFVNYVTKFLRDQGCGVAAAESVAATSTEPGYLRYSIDDVSPGIALAPVVALNPVYWESGDLPPFGAKHKASSWRVKKAGPVAALRVLLLPAGTGRGELRVYSPNEECKTDAILSHLTDSVVREVVEPFLPMFFGAPHGLFQALEEHVHGKTGKTSRDDAFAYISESRAFNQRMSRHAITLWADLLRDNLPDGLTRVGWQNFGDAGSVQDVHLRFTVSGYAFNVNAYGGYDLSDVPACILSQWVRDAVTDANREEMEQRACGDLFKVDDSECESFAQECAETLGCDNYEM